MPLLNRLPSMKHILSLLVLVLVFGTFSCTKVQMVPASEQEASLKRMVGNAAPTGDLSHWILPDPTDFENIPQDPQNPLTAEKVALGNMLFFETVFGTDASQEESIGTFSCATCHVPSAGFRPGGAQGIADGGLGFGTIGEDRVRNTAYSEIEMDVQGARPLSLISVAFVENTMWNGGFGSTGVNVGTEALWVGDHETNNLGLQGLEAQNIEGIHVHKFDYNPESIETNGYKEMFDASFPDFDESERYSDKTASFALSAYLRTIFPNEAPFQKWLKGSNTAMSDEEKEGAMLFFGKAACTNCHSGPGLSSVDFHAVGVNNMYQRPSFGTDADDLRNFGRGGFTGKAEDMHKFKVPQLYNMSDSEFYFHGSSRTQLRDVVQYFNLAEPENPEVPVEQVSDKFKKLNLTDEEVDAITLFLSKSLRDPDLNRYMPESVLSGSCIPNADYQSMLDLGCN